MLAFHAFSRPFESQAAKEKVPGDLIDNVTSIMKADRPGEISPRCLLDENGWGFYDIYMLKTGGFPFETGQKHPKYNKNHEKTFGTPA